MSKCPICETKYSNNHKMCDELRCTECYWDLTKYPLTPDGLRQEQENRIEWARDIWRQLQDLKDVDEYQALIKSNEDLQEYLEMAVSKQDELSNTIDYLLSEPTRIEARREQLLDERQLDWRNSDSNDEIKKVKTFTADEIKKVRTFTADLPFKLAETIKNKLPKSERGHNRNIWLNKVIVDAALKEGWLEEATLYQLENSGKLENNKVYFVIFQEYKPGLYLILKDKLLYSHKNIDVITFELFLKSKNKKMYSNQPKKTVFSKNEYLIYLDEREVQDLIKTLVNLGLEESKKYCSRFFSRLESYVGEIKRYDNIATGSLHWLVR